MANNFTPVGNEVQVNLAPNQNADQDDNDTAALTDGRFFVAFEDDDLDDNIIGQFVNANGTLAGANINIDITAASDQSDPAVAQRASGAAVVVWEDDTADDINYAIVSSAGVVGTVQTILDGVNGLDNPDVATLADGRSLVVATQFNTSDDVVFRFITAAGVPGPAQAFIDNGPGHQNEVAVAASGNNALVVYRDDTATPNNFDIQARFFDGTNFASEVTIFDAPGNAFEPDVAVLTDGRFIVVWTDNHTADIQARFVSAAGVPLGSAFEITHAGGFDFDARVAALPDGGFVVTWANSGGLVGGDTETVVARRFDSNGDPAGDLFLVNTSDPATFQGNPSMGVNAAGQAFIAWVDEHAFAGADTEPDAIRGRAFLPTTDVVNLTEGNDIVQTYNIAETINGLGGDDLINALGGNDIVHGNSGFDRILGGLGNDQLFGDSGEDLLNGEDGDDLLVGGLGRDVQLGGAGKDTFDFNAIAESRFGANHDLIKGFKHSENDKINLQTIDADTTAGGNQAFDLIGNAAFSGTAGELRFAAGLLQGDTNGDGIANFEVKVTGLGVAANGDFVL